MDSLLPTTSISNFTFPHSFKNTIFCIPAAHIIQMSLFNYIPALRKIVLWSGRVLFCSLVGNSGHKCFDVNWLVILRTYKGNWLLTLFVKIRTLGHQLIEWERQTLSIRFRRIARSQIRLGQCRNICLQMSIRIRSLVSTGGHNNESNAWSFRLKKIFLIFFLVKMLNGRCFWGNEL